MEDRSESLIAWARELGFDRAGVAGLEPVARGEHFLRWLERGDHAEMAWLEKRREVRLEPATLFPGARSVLCVALRYWPLAGAGEEDGDLWSGVARYARGRDYHNLMGKRLRKLAKRIREAFPGCETRAYVDTGPVLERELAARAGIGVQGKNTCLLSRDGSFFLLGEVFTSLDLTPAEPLADLCGRCTRCLEACPTDALAEPYRLDANRCISYWTIEHRGDIPEDLRPQLGEWVFGCDICQQVCPWNIRRQEGGRESDFHLPPARRELDLAGLLAIGEKDYQELFRGSAMQRAKRQGLRRNAAIAMGNRGDEGYLPALRRALLDDDAVVRRHAAWAWRRITGEAPPEAPVEGPREDAPAAVTGASRKGAEGPEGVEESVS
ncbi:MAG: tRNA epoxyqueuosine(34) reductase QueG [Acidobacteriota bacterium]